MIEQLSMFETPPTSVPYQSQSETSKAAAKQIRPNAVSLRGKVYAFIEQRGTQGATDEEIQIHCDLGGNTERPRRIELLGDTKRNLPALISAAEEKRATASGRLATVWIAISSQK